MQEQLTPAFGDYELIDTGDFEKLERFGPHVTRRPEPQAIWRRTLCEEEWRRMADASFLRDARSDERGEWRLAPRMPSRWTVDYAYKQMRLRMRLGLTSFKHVGIFPEQAANWNFIYDNCRALASGGAVAMSGSAGAVSNGAAGSAKSAQASESTTPAGVRPETSPAAGRTQSADTSDKALRATLTDRGALAAVSGGNAPADVVSATAMSAPAQNESRQPVTPRVLNLFAYTGGASLAARAAGAETTHVDSVKQVVTWARENMELSGLDGIRWIVEDALKFVQREVRRGNRYHGIILDPPAYGRGANGEKWILEENICEMLACCAQLLEPKGAFLVLNLYSMGLSSTLARTAVRQAFGAPLEEQYGELCFTDRAGKQLPLGTYYRFIR